MSEEYPSAATLPKLSLCGKLRPDKHAATLILDRWLAALQKRLERNDLADISDLFVAEAYWRDIIALTWDFHSKNGPEAISKYLKKSNAGVGQLKASTSGGLVPSFKNEYGLEFIQSGFTFETKFGYGKGVLRLANTAPLEWKAWTVLTQLVELKNEDEQALTDGEARVIGVTNGCDQGRTDHQVVIVGGGQSGLGLAAHLKHMGVRAMIVEKGAQVGNAWCQRYNSVRTHTLTDGDHLPFLKYPSNWPEWQDKARIIRWMHSYSKILDIEVQLNTSAEKAEYDEVKREWTLHVQDKDGNRVIRTRHVVMALGMVGTVPVSPDLPGRDSYQGHVYHAIEHRSAVDIPDLANKRVVVIGCATTAHDMAQDFVNHGAKSVAMIQRKPTWSFSNAAIKKYHLGDFTVPGISTEEADLLITSLPTAVARVFGYEMTQMMVRYDADLLDKLQAAGLHVKRGEDGHSFIDSLFFMGGHFYVDQGATPMILDGRIKIHMCPQGVTGFSPQGLVLGDGRQVDADVIVMATGFQPATFQLKKLMGEKIWQKAATFGMFDDELERQGWWRPTGIPGFWYMCGTLSLSRQFSAVLAVEICAVERGMVDGHWEQ